MKNKKSLYILLPLVILIWGTIFWKVFSGRSTKSNTIPYVINKTVEEKIEPSKVRPVLAYNYQDPFLKANPKSSATKEGKAEQKKPKLNRVVRWPVIEYKGMIKSKRKNKPMGLLVIDDKEFLVRQKDEKKEIQILTISKDSIGLKYQHDQRFFKRYGLN